MTDLHSPLETLRQLIAFGSVSSTSNAEISQWIAGCLETRGFDVECQEYRDDCGVLKVNLVARRAGNSDADEMSGGLAYFCHTDVVPVTGWAGPGGDPFSAVVHEDRLFGRGACDMKGSLAAMLAAVERFPVVEQTRPLWIVCTADEEVGFTGAKELVATSQAYRHLIAAQPVGIIGEPTSLSVVHAHKGITGFRVISRGRAAHSSTDEGVNANRAIVPMLQTLLEMDDQTRTDPRYRDDRFDPPTLSWNFGISDGDTALNVTPDKSVAWASMRTMPEIDGEDLIERARRRAAELNLEFERFEGGGPLSIDCESPAVRGMCELAGGEPRTVCYATDGGQFIELESMVVCGPGDIAQAHTVDEWIRLDQLEKGAELYLAAVRRWCS